MISEKKIRILDLDITRYKIEPSLDKINYDFKKSNINYSIELRKGIIAIAGESWYFENYNSDFMIFTKKNNEYYNIKIIKNRAYLHSALSYFNDEEFIISNYGGIEFYDIDNCECNNHISVNLSYITENRITLFGDYILCFYINNCGNPNEYFFLNLIYIKTKELVQIFEIKEELNDSYIINIFIENNEIIHLFLSNLYDDEQ